MNARKRIAATLAMLATTVTLTLATTGTASAADDRNLVGDIGDTTDNLLGDIDNLVDDLLGG